MIPISRIRHEIAAALPDDPYGLAWASWWELTTALRGAPREAGWEGDATVTGMRPYRCEERSCDDVRAEMERRLALNTAASLTAIKQSSTRLLLRWLYLARRFGGWYCEGDHDDPNAVGVRYDDIKTELSTREHVPNKIEGRALRRAASTKHHGPRKKRHK